MKTSINIPDDLYRKVKARSAMEGKAVREVIIDLFRKWLGEPPSSTTKDFVSAYDLARDACGVVDSGVTDLATNPEYLKGLGRDSKGDR
jgi:hypothetical protein